MKQSIKSMYEKMADYRRFAIVLLAAGVFFFLGVILPIDTRTELDLNIMMISTVFFLASSIFLFNRAKIYEKTLLESEEGQERMMKK